MPNTSNMFGHCTAFSCHLPHMHRVWHDKVDLSFSACGPTRLLALQCAFAWANEFFISKSTAHRQRHTKCQRVWLNFLFKIYRKSPPGKNRLLKAIRCSRWNIRLGGNIAEENCSEAISMTDDRIPNRSISNIFTAIDNDLDSDRRSNSWASQRQAITNWRWQFRS